MIFTNTLCIRLHKRSRLNFCELKRSSDGVTSPLYILYNILDLTLVLSYNQ